MYNYLIKILPRFNVRWCLFLVMTFLFPLLPCAQADCSVGFESQSINTSLYKDGYRSTCDNNVPLDFFMDDDKKDTLNYYLKDTDYDSDVIEKSDSVDDDNKLCQFVVFSYTNWIYSNIESTVNSDDNLIEYDNTLYPEYNNSLSWNDNITNGACNGTWTA